MLRWLPLLVLLLPVASAVETLDDLEEPHAGTDKVWEVRVTPEEAGAQRALIYRNGPRAAFGLVVYDAAGHVVFEKNGTRGVQSLPALDAGDHRFFVRGPGEFQVTKRTLESAPGERVVEGTLEGADAYLLIPRENVTVTFGGDVRVEWLDLTLAAPEQLEAPTGRTAGKDSVIVMTIRGDEGLAYRISLITGTPALERPGTDTPAPSVAALLALALALALALKRRT